MTDYPTMARGALVYKWGADWDGDWDMDEHKLIDLPHFELRL